MTPETFQTNALAWITAIISLIIAIVTGTFSVLALFKSKFVELKADNNTKRIDNHSQKLTDIMLATTPASPTTSTIINQPEAINSEPKATKKNSNA